ncbi:transcriptional regulator, ArsR family [Beijerinckia indica subsp. indica ATCC 9039]|uniref:Transcriptional regulator, ArsR family n=1 Tax=Beijerinckia indica subsp. indica (strain ATCC 9039 / DSM 1715 / NCIMB 8712) TaxID=395963 RepID=B2IEG7_BEII9|nr:transcriptional regulator, ArsR family [Beijerinckia indica subsp. indica ATCC 9039]
MDLSSLSRSQAEVASELFKSLSNPNRLQIVAALALGEHPVGDLETMLGIKQPTLSQQLAELRDAGFVESRREAKQVFYRLGDKRLLALLHALPGILQGEIPLKHEAFMKEQRLTGTAAAMFARVEPPPS